MGRVLAACAAVFSLLIGAAPATASPTGIDGVVTSAATGQPMKRIQVIAKTPSGGWVRDGYTDDNGKFDIPLTAGQQYRIYASAYQYEEALTEPVTAPGTVSIALKPFTYGSVRGTYLRKPGQPLANVTVGLTDVNGNEQDRQATDANGEFRFTRVRSGEHKIRFYFPDWSGHWYDDGRAFTVQPDQETVIQQLARPMGGAEVTITSNVTGEPVANVSVHGEGPSLTYSQATTDAQGKVRFTDLLAGKWRFLLTPPSGSGFLYSTIEDVQVREEETVMATDALEREAVLDLTFVDAATGTPVDGCYSTVSPAQRNTVAWDHFQCSTDGTGKLRVNGLRKSEQRLFAYPRTSTAHGSQWVGADGGTGDVEQAKWVGLVNGQTTSVRVKFDAAGTISGTVVDDATGSPVQGVCPSMTPNSYPTSLVKGLRCADAAGRYEISGLGPYQWPVQFGAAYGGYAWQWSGGAGNRFDATKIQVTPGGTATADARLRKPGQVTGKVVGATYPYQYVSITAVDARTGDYAGPPMWINSKYEYGLKGFDSQDVRLFFTASPNGTQEHPDTIHTEPGQTIPGIDLHVR